MKKKENNRRYHVPILLDVFTLVMTTFGSIFTRYKVTSLLVGIVTCLILVALLSKGFGGLGTVAGCVVSIVLMILLSMQVYKAPSNEFSDKLTEDTKMGTLELRAEELMVGYGDSNGNNKIVSAVNIDKDICNSIVIKSVDYDVVLKEYKVQEGGLVFSNIPVGTYDMRIQLEGFSLYSGTIKLKESELKDDIWNKTITLQSDNDYKEFQVIITDRNGEELKEHRCDFNVLNTNDKIEDIVTDEEGKLPYTFKMPNNLDFQVVLHYEEETYSKEYAVRDIDNPLKIQFPTPPKDKIPVSEHHQPDDAATLVSLPDWNVNEDIGIDGKKYGGGIKVKISDMFISMGANGSKDITSRITVPLDGNYNETIFEGVFVLDQSMYGTESTGTISILIDNKEVFTTGEIGGNTLNAFPFKIDFGNADALIILTEAHLVGSDFVYGFVSQK